MERGRIEGVSIGEKRKAVDMAKKLLAAGVEAEIIAEGTGLSIDQIEELRKSVAFTISPLCDTIDRLR